MVKIETEGKKYRTRTFKKSILLREKYSTENEETEVWISSERSFGILVSLR